MPIDIGLRADGIILTDVSNLKPYMLQQLRVWGARPQPDNTYLLPYSDNVLLKLVGYLTENRIAHTLADGISLKLDNFNTSNSEHAKMLSAGQDFKNGKFDVNLFRQHEAFIKSHLKRTLLTHQLKASFHLYTMGNAANFSVPGSGKTTVVLAYYERLKSEHRVDKLFVVGPPSSFGPWREEFQKVLGRPAVEKILAGGSQSKRREYYFAPQEDVELYLTSFQTLQNDATFVADLLDLLSGKVLLVVDEAHYMKQVDGRWATSVLHVGTHANLRCVLTGTPMPHSYRDLFNLFSFLMGARNPITASDRAHLELYEQEKNYSEAEELLQNRIGSLFYRVRKEDLGLAAQRLHEPTILQMNPIEGRIYASIAGRIARLSEEDYLRDADTIAALQKGRLMRLRQATSYPKLLTTAIPNYHEDVLGDEESLISAITKYDSSETPAKLQELVRRIRKIVSNGDKVVVWSNFIGTVNLISDTLKKEGILAKKIIGETPIERANIIQTDTREKIREEFNDPNSKLKVLIANPAACAESISLHKACHKAIYYDLSFNCAQFLQSLDRIHRVGGSEKIASTYDFLMYDRTVDPKIYANLLEKAERMQALINQDYAIYSLNMEEDDTDASILQGLAEAK